MPELPEVAGLTDFLGRQLIGTVFTKVQIVSFAVLKTADPPFSGAGGPGSHRGAPVRQVRLRGRRRGVVRLPPGTGRLGPLHRRTKRHPAENGKGHIAVRLSFSGGSGRRGLDLTEAGTKKGMAVYVVRDPDDVPGIAALGPDPFSPGSTSIPWRRFWASSSQQVKGLLRSQSVIAGIGNAYSDEILHAARISPFATAKSLDREAVQVLYDSIHSILGTALKEAGGKAPNELKDTKRSHMRVHGRTGEACPVCGDTVREVSFADTALQYCPTCQTKGKILADRRTSRFLK